jgi:3-dehydroquinate dehydratase type I
MAKEKEDNFIAFKLLEFINMKNFKSLVFCMGKNGLISRIMGPYLGNFFTFASIGAPTAPGQLSITDLKTIYEIIDKHKM